ncbi:MAG: IclR family transcriptional regulator [Alphaproteobacteria bacterium]|nr:IclR family transcriptional regulator [Alphaproteobacteria bacterium]
MAPTNLRAPISGQRPLVTSVVQAVAVLRHLASIGDGRGVTAIAATVGISPSSCFNILKTLVAEDLVLFDDQAKTYTLGLGMINLGHSATRRDAVIGAAGGAMAMLAEEYGSAVGLWRVSNRDRLMLVHLAESEAATRIHLSIGQRLPLGAGAMGRCVAAAQDLADEEIARRFAAVRWAQPPKLDTYRAQVQAARRRGYSTDVDQLLRGLSSVAAAIVDRTGSARFCLSVTMFSGQHSADAMRRIGKAVRSSADAISAAGYGTARG